MSRKTNCLIGLLLLLGVYMSVTSANDGASQGDESPFASCPDPPDGAKHESIRLGLAWTPGIDAASHDVYFGEDYGDVNTATRDSDTFLGSTTRTWFLIGFPGDPYPTGLEPGTTYYWRIDEANDLEPDSPWKGDVWSFWLPSRNAYNPHPPDGAKFVDPNVELSWSPGLNAAIHFVYFGDDYDTVKSAVDGTPQTATTYDPRTMEWEKTYYWRVDEVDGSETYIGDTWSFTTARRGGGLKGRYYLHGGTTPPDPPSSAFRTHVLTRIDGTIDFQWDIGSPDPKVHSDYFAVVWAGEIEAAFSEPYTFYTNTDDGVMLWVNDQVVIDNWTVCEATESKSEPIELLAGQQYPIQMWYFRTWAPAPAVAQLFWESPSQPKEIIPAGALSPPVRAYALRPGNSAVDVSQPLILSWLPGGSALYHDVYLGEDEEAVANATTLSLDMYRGRQAGELTTYDPSILELEKTYYWRIDGVDEADPESPWKGSVWSFTTANFIAVDDFEAYDDYCSRMFYTWVDGWGFSSDADCNVAASGGNGTGSTVGCMWPSDRRCDVAHAGMQSMRFRYTNDGSTGKALYSETEHAWDTSQDWTREGVKALTLWLYGDPCNAAEPLYVAVEDSMGKIKVINHDDPNAVQLDGWQEWNLDLQEFAGAGVNLEAVKKMYIGVGNRTSLQMGGSGALWFDDIRLYRRRCVASLLKPEADLSGNCVVDLADIEILASQWLKSGVGLTADLDADEDVDLGDFAHIADAWLEELLWPQP